MSQALLSFASLKGQDKAKTLLRHSFGSQRMSHAFLFKGPDGVGKKKCALTFAKYVNCAAPINEDACGICLSCRKFESGNHPDLKVIEPDGAFIKIEQVRELEHLLSFAPLEAKSRVVVLVDVHNMRSEAANALLKTLEEPPAGTILILTAHSSSSLLATIVSRCQVIPFFPLPYGDVVDMLMAEGGVGMEQAAGLAAVTDGSIGKALFFVQADLLAFRTRLVQAFTEPVADEASEIEMVFDLAKEAAGLKENLGELLYLLKVWLRDLMILQLGLPESRVMSRDIVHLLGPGTGRWNIDALSGKLRMIERAGKRLARNCNRELVCEVLFFAMMRP